MLFVIIEEYLAARGRDKGARSDLAEAWRIYVGAHFFIFFRFLASYFSMIFSSPIFLDFGSIWVPNLEPKSMKNRSRGRYFRRLKLHRAIFRNLKDVSHGMQGFEVPRPPGTLAKSVQNREKTYIKVDRSILCYIFEQLLYNFLLILGSILGAIFVRSRSDGPLRGTIFGANGEF